MPTTKQLMPRDMDIDVPTFGNKSPFQTQARNLDREALGCRHDGVDDPLGPRCLSRVFDVHREPGPGELPRQQLQSFGRLRRQLGKRERRPIKLNFRGSAASRNFEMQTARLEDRLEHPRWPVHTTNRGTVKGASATLHQIQWLQQNACHITRKSVHQMALSVLSQHLRASEQDGS